MPAATTSLGARLAQHAARQPDAPAVTCDGTTWTYADLHRRSNRLARGLAAAGAAAGDFVTTGLPNSLDFVAACQAIWKLGATAQPVSFRLPAAELAEIVALANPSLVIADFAHEVGPPVLGADALMALGDRDDDLPDIMPAVCKAVTSGGSTGRPKLIVSGDAGAAPAVGRFGLTARSVAVMPGPLYHNGPFVTMMHTLAMGGHLVLLPRFDAEATLRAIAAHRANWVYLVPTMMSRIWRLPATTRTSIDLSSLELLWHMAAPCPAWLKDAFIDWVAPATVMELYGGTEGIATAIISGADWRAHRGSVGRVATGEMKVVGPDGQTLPAGETGEIYMRRAAGTPETYRYVGATAKGLGDGWESLGDMGRFDADGYLYLADRLTDMILVGGANVYPAEVEAAIEEHPDVRSCAVIGLPDDDLGARIHAIVQLQQPLAPEALAAHLESRLTPYKRPRSWEFADEPLRDDAGKVRRSALRAERLAIRPAS